MGDMYAFPKDPKKIKERIKRYQSPEFTAVRKRYIEIHEAFLTLRPGPERSRLVEESFQLQGIGGIDAQASKRQRSKAPKR